MKYCTYCGKELLEDAKFCICCGNPCQQAQKTSDLGFGTTTVHSTVGGKKRTSNWILLVKIFMIIGVVSNGLALIPLLWCIPMMSMLFKKLKNGEPISMGFKVAVLLVVNMIAGIILLCEGEEI